MLSRLAALISLIRVTAAQVIIIYDAPSPPPPPLSEAKANWSALYFFVGLLGFYLVAMALVTWVFVAQKRQRAAESLPLNSQKTASLSDRPRSWMDLQRNGYEPPSLESIDKELKKGFVRKVYSILGTQLMLTVGICVLLLYLSFYHGDPNYVLHFGYYYIEQSWIIVLLFILLLVDLCGLFAFKNRYPANFIFLFFFTVILGFILGRRALSREALLVLTVSASSPTKDACGGRPRGSECIESCLP